MRCAKVKNERFTKLLAGSGICFIASRMPQACRSQTNGRVFINILRFFVVVLAVSLFSRPLVYRSFAATEFTIDTVSTSTIRESSASSKLQNYSYSRSYVTFTPVDIKDKFAAEPGDTIKFVFKSVEIDHPVVVDGNPTFSDLTTGFTDHNFTLSYIPVGASTAVSVIIYPGDDVTIPYGSGNISVSSTGTWVGKGEVAYKYTPSPLPDFSGYYEWPGATWTTRSTFVFSNIRKVLSDNDALNQINDKTQEQIDQQDRFHDEEKQQGEDSGSDASQMVQDLTDQVKSKWEILFYPIEFTQKFLSLFTSSSVGSTVISFPSFSIMGMTVWDSYDFDLSTVKNQFSTLFDLLYMVIGVIEVMWFLKYLYRKYDEVFGGQ